MRRLGILLLCLLGGAPLRADLERDADFWAATSSNFLGWVSIKADGVTLIGVQEAIESVLEEMNYVQTDIRTKTGEAVLTFRGRDDLKISVKLKEFPDYTNIKIRVGWGGNGGLSREILSAIYPLIYPES